MRTVKFTEDFTFNTHGGKGGRVSKKAGETGRYDDWLADQLVNFWEKAEYHDMQPQQTKPSQPTQQKTYDMEHLGGGWYALKDENGDIIDKVQGKGEAYQKLNELNG